MFSSLGRNNGFYLNGRSEIYISVDKNPYSLIDTSTVANSLVFAQSHVLNHFKYMNMDVLDF